MNKPHKHAEFIHAWADGKEIQCRLLGSPGSWVDFYGTWDDRFEYRIKPAAPVIETKMTDEELKEAWRVAVVHAPPFSEMVIDQRRFINAGIARAIADGQVVPVVPAGMPDAEFRLRVNKLAAKVVSGEVPLVASVEEIRSTERAKRDMAVAKAASYSTWSEIYSRGTHRIAYSDLSLDLGAIIDGAK